MVKTERNDGLKLNNLMHETFGSQATSDIWTASRNDLFLFTKKAYDSHKFLIAISVSFQFSNCSVP